jgi:CheY-like chemotaxis protein
MILIADDNPEMRRLIRGLIADIDPDVVECANGQEAVDAYNAHLPDLVLMDINMLPMDGLTAARLILSKTPEARIIIVSQHSDFRTRETALSIGVEAFIGKDDLRSLCSLIYDRV